jgi:hypothetical protein
MMAKGRGRKKNGEPKRYEKKILPKKNNMDE